MTQNLRTVPQSVSCRSRCCVATNDSLGSLSRKWRSTRSETEATLPSRIDKKISFGTLKLKSILADKTAGCSQFSKRLFRANLSCVRLSFVAHSDQQTVAKPTMKNASFTRIRNHVCRTRLPRRTIETYQGQGNGVEITINCVVGVHASGAGGCGCKSHQRDTRCSSNR